MKSTIAIRVEGCLHSNMGPVKLSEFSGGEVSVQLPFCVVNPPKPLQTVKVYVRLRCPAGVMALVLVKNALDAILDHDVKVILNMGYVPYARQDRICNEGEALSIQAFAGIINMLQFQEIFILDPHRDVTPALFNAKVAIDTQEQMLEHSTRSFDLHIGHDTLTLVSPDAGATKKTEKVSKHFGGLPVIQATKQRDLKTGDLSGFGFYGDVDGKDLLIVDDICDGGGTFVGLAKILKDAGAREIGLYVSHGIFSRGVDNLLDNGIDYIVTTSTFFEGTHEKVEVVSY